MIFFVTITLHLNHLTSCSVASKQNYFKTGFIPHEIHCNNKRDEERLYKQIKSVKQISWRSNKSAVCVFQDNKNSLP